MSRITAFGLAALVTLQLITSGCSGGAGTPELAPVEGRVTMDGEPLPNVCVHFIPENGRESVGTTDKDGKYQASYLPKVMGVRLGKQKVMIEVFFDDDTDREAIKARRKIPAKYNAQTTLTAEIKRGKNVCDFQLTSE
jgi:hypothetical protein